MNSSVTTLKREDFPHHPYYCEENIWHLCQHVQFKNSHVIFIASTGDSFPMLCQRAMPNPQTPIFWDYHVILLIQGETNQILDFDTTLAFNNDVETYFSQSFVDNALLEDEHRPLFRLIPASEYVEKFSSNRSHMKTESGWLAPPPPWPPIIKAENNLSAYIDMNDLKIGEVLTYDEMLERFT